VIINYLKTPAVTASEEQQRDEFYEALRAEFERRLTVDSLTRDARRKDFNQAIFAPADLGGWPVFTKTTLDMVLDKFDKALLAVSP
jgi:hypothetical protein